MAPTTIERVRTGLDNARGRWPEIARDTRLDYFTIARIARAKTTNPRLETVEAILGWLDGHGISKKPKAVAA